MFEELDPDKATKLLGEMSDTEVAGVLGRMRADDAADAVAELRQSRRRRVLELLPSGQYTKVITLMGFNPASAGGLMSVDVISCGSGTTAAEALEVIAAARSLQPEALLKVQVVTDAEQLIGVVSVIRLLQAEPAAAVGDLMDSDPVRVSPESDLTDVALLMADYNLVTIPVVDDVDRVLGVVTVDDILEATIPEDWRRREPAPGQPGNPETPSLYPGPRRATVMLVTDRDTGATAADQQHPPSPTPPSRHPSRRRPSRHRPRQHHRFRCPLLRRSARRRCWTRRTSGISKGRSVA